MPSPHWKHLDNNLHARLTAVLFAMAATIVVVLVGLAEFLPNTFANASNYSTFGEIAFTAAMMLFAISNLAIVVGMFRFWVACDKSSKVARRIWFVIMLVGLIRLGLGAALYCFAVYLPQVLKRANQGSEAVTP